MRFRFLSRRRDGRFSLDLPEGLRDALAESAQGLRSWMAQDPDDDDLRRLFPEPRPDDPDAASFYRLVAREQLQTAKGVDLEVLAHTAHADTLTMTEVEQWLRALNSLRLALGTRLGATEEGVEIDPDDPDAGLWALYEVLAVLIGSIVDELADPRR